MTERTRRTRPLPLVFFDSETVQSMIYAATEPGGTRYGDQRTPPPSMVVDEQTAARFALRDTTPDAPEPET